MNNPLRHPEQINPKIAADVQAALEKNRAAGRVVDGDFADSVASSSLADIVKADTAEAKETGVLADSGLEQVVNPEVRRNFETAFKDAEQLFARISLTPPTPGEFVFAGVDFARLEKEFERMTQEGLEPSLVITPSLPLTKDISPNSDKNWESLYSAMAKYSAIPNNPLKIRNNGEGLAIGRIGRDVRTSADDLLAQEEERILYANDIHTVNHGTNLSPGDAYWTVALLPTTDRPQDINIKSQDINIKQTDHGAVGDPNDSKLATISQYLTLQAIRIQSGQPPVDETADTCLQGQGIFQDETRGPFGHWGSFLGQVRVGCLSGPHANTGVRLPVWG